jgi:hypothetical protein
VKEVRNPIRRNRKILFQIAEWLREDVVSLTSNKSSPEKGRRDPKVDWCAHKRMALIGKCGKYRRAIGLVTIFLSSVLQ